jgi:Metallo-peptidase family M12B Reprolysin-like
MGVQFAEVWKRSGLDVDSKPFPGMILPLGGSNVIRVLNAQGSSLFDDKGILEIKEIDAAEFVLNKYFAFTVPIFKVMAGYPGEMAALQLRLATDVAQQLAHNGRYIRITGRALGGEKGTMLRVGIEPNTPLRVVVLRPRLLKLSIRPVQVRNDKGSLVYHCEKNYDAKALLNQVNAVWTPQANIVFALASSDPALLDDQAAIAIAVKSTSPKATVPPIIEFNDFSEMFQKLRDKEKPRADFSIFLVHRMTHGGDNAFGTTNQKGGFALVSDSGVDEDANTMAHEIGHYFGYGPGHNDVSRDLLMYPEAPRGTKIPFSDVIKHFNTNYK